MFTLLGYSEPACMVFELFLAVLPFPLAGQFLTFAGYIKDWSDPFDFLRIVCV